MKKIKLNGTTSYKSLIFEHVEKLNVSTIDHERKDFYRALHRLMAMAGIITFQSIGESRRKPYKNSPFGEYINFIKEDNARKHIDGFYLNETGRARVQEILKKYVTDNFLTKGEIESAKELKKDLQNLVDGDILLLYLERNGYKFEVDNAGENNTRRIIFWVNEQKHVHYENNNLIWNSSKATNPFFFIRDLELCLDFSKKNKGKIAGEIFSALWNYKFGNEVIEWAHKPTANKKKEDLKEEIKRELLAEILQNKVATSGEKVKRVATKTEILNILQQQHKPLNLHQNFKTISEENIQKLSGKKKEQLQNAFEYLKKRRLNTAKYRPVDGWKFDFKTDSIQILYKIDRRKSSVYNTRRRPLNPVQIDGKLVKELASKGQKYSLPFNLDNLDYSFKYIFVTEGAFDCVFLKNCLGYSNWILPHEMNATLQFFRNYGFKIIHILDNFRVGDKGGIRGLQSIVNRDFMRHGDKIYSWAEYSECKDLNEIAVKNNQDEIDPEIIIRNSWTGEEARQNISKFCFNECKAPVFSTLSNIEYESIFEYLENFEKKL